MANSSEIRNHSIQADSNLPKVPEIIPNIVMAEGVWVFSSANFPWTTELALNSEI